MKRVSVSKVEEHFMQFLENCDLDTFNYMVEIAFGYQVQTDPDDFTMLLLTETDSSCGEFDEYEEVN